MFRVSMISFVSALLFASPSFAVLTISATAASDSGRPLNALHVGDVVTIDVTARSSGASEPVFALGLSAGHYNESVADFTGGLAPKNLFNGACFPGAGCFGGIENILPGAVVSNPFSGYTNIELQEDSVAGFGNRVQMFNGVTLAGATVDGSNDVGVDGNIGSPQFQILFTAMGLGETDVFIGVDPNLLDAFVIGGGGGGIVLDTIVGLRVIPEPGTALLMGLGLAGLATRRRTS